MKKNVFLITKLVILLFIGCTTTQSVMDSWLGHDESELISSWGAPDSTFELKDGTKIYTWKRVWRNNYGTQEGRQSFTIDSNGKITKWRYENMPAF